ncbi:hypothetical protein BCR44DRAFT_1484400 [Catenaria anguillulae PL171]|uniref:Uncharacterized protein n=1 Tax=Catenaria anguillulae PL171 TaxID=765915 RepID=A0A1Y2HSM3_9FUNG|nr:hypothetical protein BCR44DRAFT_1484400 [Catenaria anguillulae PL171]
MQMNPTDAPADQSGHAGRQLPLPAEIIAMSEGETACRFCGVSYLLLSRMEALQREFATLEKELEARKQYAEERPGLLERVRMAEEQSQGFRASLEEQHGLNQLLQESTAQWKLKYQLSERRLDQTTQDLQAMSSRLLRSQALIRKSSGTIRVLKQEVDGLKRETVSSLRLLRTSVKESLIHVQTHANVLVEAQIADRVRESNLKLSQEFEEQNTVLRSQVDDLALQVAQSQHNVRQMTEAKNKADAELSVERQRVADMESTAAQYSAKLNEERQALQISTDAWKAKEASLTATLQAVHRELDSSLENARKIASQLDAERQLRTEVERALADARAAQTSSQASREKLIDDLRIKHVALEQRIRQMEAERADTVAAHQNRLVQLQASFQEKLVAAQNQREQECKQESAVVVGALEKDLAATRAALKQIQEAEQAAKEQVRKLQNEMDAIKDRAAEGMENVKRLHDRSRVLEQEKRSALAALDELKRRHNAATEQHIMELEQCKLRISELELERNKVLREVQSKQASQLQWTETKRQLEEEIVALKETVRDECEERLKLIEQLNAFRSGASSVAGSTASLNRGGAVSPRTDTPSRAAAVASPGNNRPSDGVAGGFEAYFESKLEKASAKKSRKIRALGR